MQYLLLIYEAEQIWEAKSEQEREEVLRGHGVLQQSLRDANVEFAGNPLMPTSTAVSVRKRGSDVQITDGPFAETKEQLAGYYLVDVESMEDAIKFAQMIPNCDAGVIEVRPLANHSVPED